MKRRAVILDRDGTLIEDAGYLDRLDRLELFPYTVDSVRLLNRAGFAVVVATNQSGVARGIVEEAFVDTANAYISDRLAAAGARIDAWYYCPHHPDAVREAYRVRCDCRKPQPGMLHRAARELDVDLTRSFAVGDRLQDLEAGAAAGAQGILVRTGHGRTAEAAPRSGPVAASVDNLIDAVAWILRHS